MGRSQKAESDPHTIYSWMTMSLFNTGPCTMNIHNGN